jgi:hypothetical protein
MTAINSTHKSNFIAALLLVALVGLLAAHRAHAADLFRLDRIAIVRFTSAGTDRLSVQQGVLSLEGTSQWRPASQIARPAHTPDWALNRNLVTVEAWLAYYRLGSGALDGFILEEGAMTIRIGDQGYKAVAVDPEMVSYRTDGRLINISTRAVLASAADELISGFVIEHRPRAVLIRVVGPGLAKFGVTNFAPDPFLSVKRNGQTLHYNDNWSTRSDAALIAAATAHGGAFPLENGSADAARVLILQPGAYTVHATTAGPAVRGGAVLLEIYSLPDDAIYEDPAL